MAKKRKLQNKPEPEPKLEPKPESSEEEEEEEEVSSSEEEGEEEEEEEEEEDEESAEEEPSPAPNASGSGSGSEITFDEVRALLAPLPKDQLISLLAMAAVTHPSVLRSIQDTAETDTSHRNLFVHGIPRDATTDTLQSFFGRFGDVEHIFIVADKVTGVSKGYAFVLFKTRAAAQKALDEPNKVIGSRVVSYQLAASGPPPAAGYADHNRKIYVANVNPDVNVKQLIDFFSTFGEIEKGPLGVDKVTGRPKGYALFLYKTPEGAKRALECPRKEFMGHWLTCSMALEHPPAVGGPQTASSTAVAHNPAVPAERMKMEPTIEKVQMAENNHFVAPPAVPVAARPVAPPAVSVAARPVAPPSVLGGGSRYSQPISLPALAANEELSQVVGQAVGQVLTAMGLDRILGGAQAPAANAMVPPGQGGYGASTVVQGEYGASPHLHGEYGASLHAHVPGGHGAILQEQGRYGAVMQSVYGAGGPTQGGHGASSVVQGGYGASPHVGEYGASSHAHVPDGHGAILQEQGRYGAGMQSVYGAGGPMQGGYGAAPQTQGGYVSPVVGRGGVGPEYPPSGYGGYRNLNGYGGYGNPPPYR